MIERQQMIDGVVADVIAEEIHKSLVEDAFHPQFYECVLSSSNTLEIIVQLVQFLDLRTGLKKKIGYENAYPILCRLLDLLRPDLRDAHITAHYACALLRQDFLYENLQQKRGFFLPGKNK
jgi:hypothetical protein